MTLYAELMKATGKAYTIENCHWGRCSASDDSSCPTADWCPFNWFRTSGDINSSPMSWLSNLQTTIPFQDRKAPLSQPGCWAYPDMLEVGRIYMDGKVHVPWNRAHFGAWCVVSAPLILGLDLTKPPVLAPVMDILTNAEAIAVNQAWAGHPGGLVWSTLGGATGFPTARRCDPTDASLKQTGWGVARQAGGTVMLIAPPMPDQAESCLEARGGGARGGAGYLLFVPCNHTVAGQNFDYNVTSGEMRFDGHCVDVHGGGPLVWMYPCSETSPHDVLLANHSDGTLRFGDGELCLGDEERDPAGEASAVTLQAWSKPLPADEGLALLLINPDSKPHAFDVPLASLPLTGAGLNLTTVPFRTRDIWNHKDVVTPLRAGAKATLYVTVGGLDSVFLRLAPGSQ